MRLDLDMAFVMDVTGSMKEMLIDGEEVNYTDEVRDAAGDFIEKFNENVDRVALVRFANGAVVDHSIDSDNRGFDKTDMKDTIGGATFNGSTNFAEGFRAAKEQLDGIDEEERSSLRAIVFFTDGSPNTFSSTFTLGNGTTVPGSISSSDNGPNNPGDGVWGIYAHDEIAKAVDAGLDCYEDFNRKICYDDPLRTRIPALPPHYNPPGVMGDDFDIITNFPRQVGDSLSYENVNRIARNLPEVMAAQAREEGIFVFTLGIGQFLQQGTGADAEVGQDVLIRMANDKRMLTEPTWDHLKDDFQPTPQTAGQYCFAENQAQLDSCYGRLANAILRLTK